MFAFVLFEVCCGLYYPTMGMIRSKNVPEAQRSTIMTIFRVPLNLIVAIILSNVRFVNSFFLNFNSFSWKVFPSEPCLCCVRFVWCSPCFPETWWCLVQKFSMANVTKRRTSKSNKWFPGMCAVGASSLEQTLMLFQCQNATNSTKESPQILYTTNQIICCYSLSWLSLFGKLFFSLKLTGFHHFIIALPIPYF
jgi:hypothetical protein